MCARCWWRVVFHFYCPSLLVVVRVVVVVVVLLLLLLLLQQLLRPSEHPWLAHFAPPPSTTGRL